MINTYIVHRYCVHRYRVSVLEIKAKLWQVERSPNKKLRIRLAFEGFH